MNSLKKLTGLDTGESCILLDLKGSAFVYIRPKFSDLAIESGTRMYTAVVFSYIDDVRTEIYRTEELSLELCLKELMKYNDPDKVATDKEHILTSQWAQTEHNQMPILV